MKTDPANCRRLTDPSHTWRASSDCQGDFLRFPTRGTGNTAAGRWEFRLVWSDFVYLLGSCLLSLSRRLLLSVHLELNSSGNFLQRAESLVFNTGEPGRAVVPTKDMLHSFTVELQLSNRNLW